MKRSHKIIFAIILATIASFILLFAILVYLLLFSPDFLQSSFTRIKPAIERLGIDLQADSLMIQPLSGIKADNLSIRFKHPSPISGTLSLKAFELEYSLDSFWKNRLIEIHNLSVSGIKADLNVQLSGKGNEEEEGKDDNDSSETLFSVEQALHSLPISITLKALEIRDTQLDLALDMPDQLIKLNLAVERLLADAKINRNRAEGSWSLDQSGLIQLQLTSPSSSSNDANVTGSFKLGSDGKVVADFFDSDWKANVDVSRLEILLSDLETNLDSGQTIIDLNSLELNQPLTIIRPLGRFTTLKELNEKKNVLVQFLPLTIKSKGNIHSKNFKFLNKKVSAGNDEGQKDSLLIDYLNFNHDLLVTIKGLDAKSLNLSFLNLKTNLSDTEFKSGFTDKVEKITSVSTYRLKKLHWSAQLKTSSSKNEGLFDFSDNLVLSDLIAAGKMPLSLTNLHLDNKFHLNLLSNKFDLNSKALLNDKHAMSINLKVSDLIANSKFRLGFNVNTPEFLQIFKNGLLSDLPLDPPIIRSTHQVKLENKAPLWEVGEISDLGEEVTYEGEISLKPKKIGSKNRPISFQEARLNIKSNLSNNELKTAAKINLIQLSHKLLDQKLNLKQDLLLKTSLNQLFNLDCQTKLVGADSSLELSVNTRDDEQSYLVKSSLTTDVSRNIGKYFNAASALEKIGDASLTNNLELKVFHGEKSIADLKPENLLNYKYIVNGIHSIGLSSGQNTEQPLVKLPEPLSIETSISIDQQALDFKSSVFASAIHVPALVSLKELRVKSQVKMASLIDSKGLEAKVNGEVDHIDLKENSLVQYDLSKLIKPLIFNAEVNSEQLESFEMKKFNLSVGGKLLKVNAFARADTDGKGSLKSTLKLNLPGYVSEELYTTGKFDLTTELSTEKGDMISLLLKPRFSRIGLKFQDFQMTNLSGSFTVEENLSFKDGEINFFTLKEYNPFNRVDYSYVEPAISQKPSLFIESLRFQGKSIGPVQLSPEIEQNLILMNNFKANIFEGSAVGRLFLDLNPSQLKAGFLGRFTRINPEKIISDNKNLKSNKFISGRSAIAFDVKKRLVDGRLDVTTIGRQQLLDLLDVIDPKREDSQISSARKALYLAYPTKVTVVMGKGTMDLAITLSGAISQTMNIRSLPLTPLIESHVGEILLELESYLGGE